MAVQYLAMLLCQAVGPDECHRYYRYCACVPFVIYCVNYLRMNIGRKWLWWIHRGVEINQ